MSVIKIIKYSDKSIAVFGDTKEIKDKFKINGQYVGRFNKFLSVTDEQTSEISKQAGWIFPIKHKEFIENIVDTFLKNNQLNLEDAFGTSKEETFENVEEQEQQPLF